MVTLILGITELASNQVNAHITVNDGFTALERSANRPLVNAAVGAGPWAVTESEFTRNMAFRASGASGDFNITFPITINANETQRFFIVENADTVDTATITAATTPGVTQTLLPQTWGIFYMVGVDIYKLADLPLDGGIPYDLGGFVGGTPNNTERVFKFVAVRPFTMPINLTGSQAHVNSAPASGAEAFDIQKNGSSIGTMSFAQTTGVVTFTFTTAQSFVAGDRLAVIASGAVDVAIADIGFTFKGSR